MTTATSRAVNHPANSINIGDNKPQKKVKQTNLITTAFKAAMDSIFKKPTKPHIVIETVEDSKTGFLDVVNNSGAITKVTECKEVVLHQSAQNQSSNSKKASQQLAIKWHNKWHKETPKSMFSTTAKVALASVAVLAVAVAAAYFSPLSELAINAIYGAPEVVEPSIFDQAYSAVFG